MPAPRVSAPPAFAPYYVQEAQEEVGHVDPPLPQPLEEPRPGTPAPAPQIAPRAPAVVILPSAEGPALMLEQPVRDGAPAAPVDAPRRPAVVTPVPSLEEVARLRREVVAKQEAAAAPEPQLAQVRTSQEHCSN